MYSFVDSERATELSTQDGPPEAPPPSPAILADLMLAAALRRRAEVVALEALDGRCTITLRRAGAVVGALDVPPDVGMAAAARIAKAARLDPLAATGSPEGRGNVTRIRVRAGGEEGELLVAIGATSRGIDVELRLLSVNGRPLDARANGQLRRCPSCGAFQLAPRETCDKDGDALAPVFDNPVPGGTVGVYCVRSVRGEGGMGTVLEGEHALIGRPVAIKIIKTSLAKNPIASRQFLSEARASSRVRHPNLVEVTDYGLLASGQPFMVMELLDGEPLEALLGRVGPLPELLALKIAHEIALGLAAAHEAGILHNDLKPSNVMLLGPASERVAAGDTPRLKLIDFGAASLIGAAAEAERSIIGTPRYMAPERILGEVPDARADIYAVGIVLFEMLTGNAPFVGSHDDARRGHVTHPVPPVQSPFGALPQSTTRVVRRALEKSPSARHQTAAELASDLQRAISTTTRDDWMKWLP